jgi:hypothetical protein
MVGSDYKLFKRKQKKLEVYRNDLERDIYAA